MPADKYSAVWVSHSSISDFLKCPRAYYLNNLYKDPATGHKIQLISPPLALGSVVHDILESLSVLETEERLKKSLVKRLEEKWDKVSGEKGGFFDEKTEERYKERGREMMRKVMKDPGPLEKLAVKLPQDLPHYWLSEEDNIILCGKIDWLEYLQDEDAVHIIDFKTGRSREEKDSLQLPIYYLLVDNLQKRKVAKASYWYLESDAGLVEKDLPDLDEAHEQVLQTAKKMKLARQLEHFKCPQGEEGCPVCRPLERILTGEAKKVGVSDYNQDMYVLDKAEEAQEAKIL